MNEQEEFDAVSSVALYIISRIMIVALVIGLVVGAFFSSMKTSNVYFLLNDALTARLNVILLGEDIEDNSRYFSYNYLMNEEYVTLKENYSIYIITNYGHKFTYGNLFVFPWQKTKTVTVHEAVFSINGELDTTQMTKADAMAYGIFNIPEGQDSTYKVKLKYIDGSWQVDSIIRKGDYDYEPVKTPDLTDEEIEALKTPEPEVTPTPSGEIDLSNGRSATISTAITGETVNLREGPLTAYKIIAKLKNGDKVTVKEESDGWYLVETADGVEGYVSGYYISFD